MFYRCVGIMFFWIVYIVMLVSLGKKLEAVGVDFTIVCFFIVSIIYFVVIGPFVPCLRCGKISRDCTCPCLGCGQDRGKCECEDI